jgi:predicted kinase
MAGVLIVLGGLPGTGKTTIAREVARRLGAAYVRIDAVEAALVATGLVASQDHVGAAGYVVAGSVCDSSLEAGIDVVVDAVNPVAEAREGWTARAARHGQPVLCVEVVCSDVEEHRRRVTGRRSDLPALTAPSWQQVLDRHYEPWPEADLVVDNVGDVERCVERVVAAADALSRPFRR